MDQDYDLESEIKKLREDRRQALARGDNDEAGAIFAELHELAKKYADLSMAGLELAYDCNIEEELIQLCHVCGKELEFEDVCYGGVDVSQASCCGEIYAERE